MLRLFVIALALICGSPLNARAETAQDTTERWALHYIQRWARSQGLAAPLPSSALIAAARDNSRALCEVDGAVPAGASAYLRQALERRAVYDAITPAVALVGTRPELERGLSRFAKRAMAARGPTHVGVGAAASEGGRQVLTVVVAHRLVSLTPVRPRLGRAYRICGRLAARPQLLARRAAARVLVKTPDGEVQTRAVHGPRFCARFPAPS
ncbi:MAG: hypothetical protein KC503_09240, partial [Myxococcales bacterium]|nr:hypothetical protein [Myxococcales bacterium]